MKFKEIWVDIKEYEGLYQISNLGKVKSLKRKTTNQHCKENKILKNNFDKDGYLQVRLSKNGKAKTKRVHQLVAEAFIPNPNNFNSINHKNEIKNDNRVENLEWCSVAYNNAYGSRCKAINQYDLDNNYVRTWKSAKEIVLTLGFKKAGNITSCCKKRPHCKTAYGYKWRYVDEI